MNANSCVLDVPLTGGIVGQVDLDTGRCYVAGYEVGSDPEIVDTTDPNAEYVVVVGRIGDRLKRFVKRIVRKAPLRKALGALGRIAGKIAPMLPPPFGTVAQAASRASNMVSQLGRGNPNARRQVAQIAETALHAANPNAPAARTALNLVHGLAQGRVPQGVTTAFQMAQRARTFAQQLAQRNPQATTQAVQLRAAAESGNPNARVALESLRMAYRNFSQTAGVGDDIAHGARVLWGYLAPRVGIRSSDESPNRRDYFINGLNVLTNTSDQRNLRF